MIFDTYVRVFVIAFLTLLIGVPLWIVIESPDEFGSSIFVDPFFWFLILFSAFFVFIGAWAANRKAS